MDEECAEEVEEIDGVEEQETVEDVEAVDERRVEVKLNISAASKMVVSATVVWIALRGILLLCNRRPASLHTAFFIVTSRDRGLVCCSIPSPLWLCERYIAISAIFHTAGARWSSSTQMDRQNRLVRQS